MSNEKEIPLDINSDEASIKNVIRSIQARCPVYKLNFSDQSSQVILGMYLMCFTPDKINELLKEKGIRDELHDNTLLFFDRHHITELCNIFHGIFLILISKNIISKTYEEKCIKDIACTIGQPLYYYDIKQMANSVCNSLIYNNNIPTSIVDRIKAVLEDIWFVSYAGIDELIRDATDMYEKESKEVQKNDNKTD